MLEKCNDFALKNVGNFGNDRQKKFSEELPKIGKVCMYVCMYGLTVRVDLGPVSGSSFESGEGAVPVVPRLLAPTHGLITVRTTFLCNSKGREREFRV